MWGRPPGPHTIQVRCTRAARGTAPIPPCSRPMPAIGDWHAPCAKAACRTAPDPGPTEKARGWHKGLLHPTKPGSQTGVPGSRRGVLPSVLQGMLWVCTRGLPFPGGGRSSVTGFQSMDHHLGETAVKGNNDWINLSGSKLQTRLERMNPPNQIGYRPDKQTGISDSDG